MRRVDETSAGGLVLDRPHREARAALIGRLDRRGRLLWSLPKGHLEQGETDQQAAVREVHEETGILGVIDFWFVAEGRRVHKTVHHFLLLAVDPVGGLELSDADVEVSEVAWVPLEDVPARLAYADERRLLDRVPSLLDGTSDDEGSGDGGASGSGSREGRAGEGGTSGDGTSLDGGA